MSRRYLGETLDIHGGGDDLIFPHHECEIAQSEGATGKPFARYWAHNGLLNLGAEKMSKSVGNTLSIREMVKRHDPEAIRLYLLGAHYRHPFDFSAERIAESGRGLARLRGLVTEAERLAARGTPPPGPDNGLFDEVAGERARFEAAMDDDFNTPQALGVLFDLARTLQGARAAVAEGRAGAGAFLMGVGELVTLGRTLGLLEARVEAAREVDSKLKAKIDSLVWLRQEARKRRDFAEADRLRTELESLDVIIEDTRDGTSWRLRR
jgi:cysteinyl-tRNA synthetase